MCKPGLRMMGDDATEKIEEEIREKENDGDPGWTHLLANRTFHRLLPLSTSSPSHSGSAVPNHLHNSLALKRMRAFPTRDGVTEGKQRNGTFERSLFMRNGNVVIGVLLFPAPASSASILSAGHCWSCTRSCSSRIRLCARITSLVIEIIDGRG